MNICSLVPSPSSQRYVGIRLLRIVLGATRTRLPILNFDVDKALLLGSVRRIANGFGMQAWSVRFGLESVSGWRWRIVFLYGEVRLFCWARELPLLGPAHFVSLCVYWIVMWRWLMPLPDGIFVKFTLMTRWFEIPQYFVSWFYLIAPRSWS